MRDRLDGKKTEGRKRWIDTEIGTKGRDLRNSRTGKRSLKVDGE